MNRLTELVFFELNLHSVEYCFDDSYENLWAEWSKIMENQIETAALNIINYKTIEEIQIHHDKSKVEYLKKYVHGEDSDFFNWYFKGISEVLYLFTECNEPVYSGSQYNVYYQFELEGERYTAFELQYDAEFIRLYLRALNDFIADSNPNKTVGDLSEIELPLNNSGLSWKKNKIDFIELVKALVENKAFGDVTQKQVVTTLNEFFNVGLNEDELRSGKKFQDLKKRNADEEIKYLNDLRQDLDKWIKKET